MFAYASKWRGRGFTPHAAEESAQGEEGDIDGGGDAERNI